jgi:beta-xylosidase
VTETSANLASPLIYTNPVYDGYLADPFVWEHEGHYYAVGTGLADSDEADAAAGAERRVFPLVTSPDLVHWTSLGGALVHPDPSLGNQFWAPEVAYSDGKFYLYYSIGGGMAELTTNCVSP